MVPIRDFTNQVYVAVTLRVVILSASRRLRTTGSVVCVRSTVEAWSHIPFLSQHRRSLYSAIDFISVNEIRIKPTKEVIN